MIATVDIVEFFIKPYRETSAIYIILEFVAAFFGVLSVVYAKKENILVYPTGIVSTVLYVYLLSRWVLYGDMIINIYYTLMSIYGWYMWSKVIDDKKHHIPISWAKRRDYLIAGGIFVFTTAFVIFVYRHYNVMPNDLNFRESIDYAVTKLSSHQLNDLRAGAPYIDTFATGIFFAAMWFMANKKIENWILWIIGDFVSVPLYFVKGYGFTGIQYTIFLILAVAGYMEWKKKYNVTKLLSDKVSN
jgi:nicotinamide mononucleotide transporter